ncbi:MAG: Hsp20/alpha crystallin family protein [Aeromonadales bacterium]|nr:Hsp20/alpha crystallin family protein [Aeromonadales bacterium]MDY2890968.1 Hsp20/alpha crystallin family protein [Succinivibrio sp.]
MANKMSKVFGNKNYTPTIFDWFARPLADFDIFKGQMAPEMKTDIMDKGDHYELKSEIPGVDKKDIKLSFNDGILTVNAVRSENKDEKDKNGYVVHERSEGSYERQFSFEDADPNGIEASFDNGLLKVEVKKAKEQQKSTQIQIH